MRETEGEVPVSEKVAQYEVTLSKLITECVCKSDCSLLSVSFLDGVL